MLSFCVAAVLLTASCSWCSSTTRWEVVSGNLIVDYTGSNGAQTFGPMAGTNGTGFKIEGTLPQGLVISLPASWELDLEDESKITVSDQDRMRRADEVEGLTAPAVKVIGPNTITLNAENLYMTAWLVNALYTTRWEIVNGSLVVDYTGSNGAQTFASLGGNQSNGFKIKGTLPQGLVINLPSDWELDVDDSSNVTVSDTSRIRQASEVDGLTYPEIKILGSNTITLKASDMDMTAWYVGGSGGDSGSNGDNGGSGGGGGCSAFSSTLLLTALLLFKRIK